MLNGLMGCPENRGKITPLRALYNSPMSVISTYLNQSPFIALCRSVRQRTDAAAREVVPCIVGVHTQKD